MPRQKQSQPKTRTDTPLSINRRTVLQATGGLVGGSLLAGNAGAQSAREERIGEVKYVELGVQYDIPNAPPVDRGDPVPFYTIDVENGLMNHHLINQEIRQLFSENSAIVRFYGYNPLPATPGPFKVGGVPVSLNNALMSKDSVPIRPTNISPVSKITVGQSGELNVEVEGQEVTVAPREEAQVQGRPQQLELDMGLDLATSIDGDSGNHTQKGSYTDGEKQPANPGQARKTFKEISATPHLTVRDYGTLTVYDSSGGKQ